MFVVLLDKVSIKMDNRFCKTLCIEYIPVSPVKGKGTYYVTEYIYKNSYDRDYQHLIALNRRAYHDGVLDLSVAYSSQRQYHGHAGLDSGSSQHCYGTVCLQRSGGDGTSGRTTGFQFHR